MKWRETAGSPIFIRKLNFFATGLWLSLAIPTMLWWKTSILWVALASIYANIVSHYTAWIAARVEVRAQDLQEKDRERIRHMDAMVGRMEQQNIALISWARELSTELLRRRLQ